MSIILNGYKKLIKRAKDQNDKNGTKMDDTEYRVGLCNEILKMALAEPHLKNCKFQSNRGDSFWFFLENEFTAPSGDPAKGFSVAVPYGSQSPRPEIALLDKYGKLMDYGFYDYGTCRTCYSPEEVIEVILSLLLPPPKESDEERVLRLEKTKEREERMRERMRERMLKAVEKLKKKKNLE
jgi:hypothetical protein